MPHHMHNPFFRLSSLFSLIGYLEFWLGLIVGLVIGGLGNVLWQGFNCWVLGYKPLFGVGSKPGSVLGSGVF